MFSQVVFEIVGSCNAQCAWCVTGRRNRESKSPIKYVEVERFREAIKRLFDLKLISGNSFIHLYNWGEPLLHPEINQILSVLNSYNLTYGISTNASIPCKITENLSNLKELKVSMPGFSQKSYDKIHRLNFSKILKNIDDLLRDAKGVGYAGTVNVMMHAYQFNIAELMEAKEYFNRRSMTFSPYAAYIADFDIAMSYRNNSLDFATLKKLSQELLLYYVDEQAEFSPKNYTCPQFKMLTIDDECNIITCCVLPKGHADYLVGDVFGMDPASIYSKKLEKKICKACTSSGLAFSVHNPVWFLETIERLTNQPMAVSGAEEGEGDRVTTRLQTSLTAFNQGDLVTAEETCRAALLMAPSRHDAWTLHGMILRRLGRHQEAIAAYQKAIVCKPDYADVHFNLGNLLRDLGQREDAQASYLRASNLNPNNANYRQALADATNAVLQAGRVARVADPRSLAWRSLSEATATLLPPHHGVNESLLSLARPPWGLALDIGCGTGKAGAWLKQRFPGGKVMGIESNQAAASEAASRLDRVWCAPLEEVDLQADGVALGSIGLLILGDILEHLYNPWQALLRLRPYLSPQAQILASIPNARDIGLIHPLVQQGKWEYELQGLLDITHIRFFTAASMRDMFTQTGYRIDNMSGALDLRFKKLYQTLNEKIQAGEPAHLQMGRLTVENITADELVEFCSVQFQIQASVDQTWSPNFLP